MTTPFLVFYTLVVLTLLLSIPWWQQFNNRFVVEPHGRERLVAYRIIDGKVRVLGPGTHFLPIWWRELAKVSINREPIRVPELDGGQGDEAPTADGPKIIVDWWCQMVAGREFDEHTGNLLSSPDNENSIKDKFIVQAVTKIDFPNRKQIITNTIRSEIDNVTGDIEFDCLARPSKHPGQTIPYDPTCGIILQPVSSSSELYRQLSQLIETLVNRNLRYVGINIVDFAITNIRPADPRLQESIEREAMAQRNADAADAVLQRSGSDKLSYREALVATNPDAFAQVATANAEESKALAWRDVGRYISDAFRNIGKGGRPS